MNKLIIENKSGLPWLDVLAYVASVVNMGRISNDGKQYCYASTFKTPAGTVVVASDLNEKSDRLVVYLEAPQSEVQPAQ